MTFGRPGRPAGPRKNALFAKLAGAAISGLRRLDQWQLSQQHGPQSAEDVLDWAQRIEAREPGFASDLRAAALRSMDIKAR
jgi:hypothetical protein